MYRRVDAIHADLTEHDENSDYAGQHFNLLISRVVTLVLRRNQHSLSAKSSLH